MTIWDHYPIRGRLRACAEARRAYQRAGDTARAERMQHRIDVLLDDYNAATFRHLIAEASGGAREAQEG